MAISKQRIKKIEQVLSLNEDKIETVVFEIVHKKGGELNEKTREALVNREIKRAKKNGTYKEPHIIVLTKEKN